MWGLMKKKLREVDTPSVPRLAAAIRKEWDNFELVHMQTYASSLPKRLKEIIAAKGYPVDY